MYLRSGCAHLETILKGQLNCQQQKHDDRHSQGGDKPIRNFFTLFRSFFERIGKSGILQINPVRQKLEYPFNKEPVVGCCQKVNTSHDSPHSRCEHNIKSVGLDRLYELLAGHTKFFGVTGFIIAIHILQNFHNYKRSLLFGLNFLRMFLASITV